MRKRLNIFLPEPLYNEIKQVSKTMGLSMTDLCALIMQAGFMSMKISQDPMWKNYFESVLGANNAKTD